MKALKKLKIKRSERGITFSFAADTDTFDVGQHYRYLIDTRKGQLVILPAESGHVVSRKKVGERFKSLFDIRRQDALHAFKGADYLQVSVYGDRILVEGYKDETHNCSASDDSTVITLENRKIKRIARRIVRLDELRLAAGMAGQISIEEIIGDYARIERQSAPSAPFNLGGYRDLRLPLSIVSCFAGAGILDYAFVKSGFEVLFAIEKDADACKTYRQNLGTHIVNGDVCAYPKENVPKATAIIGGPPCRPFTKERQDRYKEGCGVDDHPDAMLFQEYLHWVRETGDYSVFVIENVPDLLKASDGAYLEMVKRQFPDYELSWGIVNDAEQGGFQLRDRAIIIGSKIGKIDVPAPVYDKSHYRTVKEALMDVDATWPNYDDLTVSSAEVTERMSYVPQGGNWQSIPAHLQTKARHSNAYHRLSPERPSVTLVNWRKPPICHMLENRTLRVSEAAALTGLDKTFRFMGGLGAMQQQIGNCVPVAIGKAVAGKVKDAITAFNQKAVSAVYGI